MRMHDRVGVVEVHFEDLDKEVDGVAGEVALGPAPAAFFDNETGKGGQLEVVRQPLSCYLPYLM